MKSDISRQTFSASKQYITVVMQQGRVQTDADWNEQADIFLYNMHTRTRDAIGHYGVPEVEGGFRVFYTPDFRDLVISSGRLYIDGMLCELEHGVYVPIARFDEKARHIHLHELQIDGRPVYTGQWIALCGSDEQQKKLVQITAIDEDKNMLTFRGDITGFSSSNLRLHSVLTYMTQPAYPDPAHTKRDEKTNLLEWDLKEGSHLFVVYLDVWQRHISAIEDEQIREVALGGPDTAARTQLVAQVKLIPIVIASDLEHKIDEQKTREQEQAKLTAIGAGADSKTAIRLQELTDQMRASGAEIEARLNALACETAFPEWNSLSTTSTGTLNAHKSTGTSSGTANVRKQANRALENQLYRIEVHQGNIAGEARADASPAPFFKWAYDNASVVSAIQMVDGNRITVNGVGPNSSLGFAKGKWVEITDDHTELMEKPGVLLQIATIDAFTNDLIMEESVQPIDLELHPKIRLWEWYGKLDAKEAWQSLDGNIDIRFFEGTYKRGDYWLIPARVATNDIEWPRYGEGNTVSPIPQSPRGSQHRYARLAHIVRYKQPIVQDRRRRFAPLASDAMHITGFNWKNDTIRSRDFLKHDGLHIVLDALPRPESITGATMIVAVEPTIPGGGDSRITMSGAIKVDYNVIHWHWLGEKEEGALPELLDKLNILFRKSSAHLPRVRVTLKGHMIWGLHDGHQLYLDGQTFGVPDKRDNGTFRTGLQLPSGSGRRASDFESWFYLT